jgi:hypothetical protein
MTRVSQWCVLTLMLRRLRLSRRPEERHHQKTVADLEQQSLKSQ